MLTGTLVNVGAILAGAVVGDLVGGRLSDSARRCILLGLGLAVLAIGIEVCLIRRRRPRYRGYRYNGFRDRALLVALQIAHDPLTAEVLGV